MAGSSLLTLLDDIATLLDDISVMGKIAAKKTAGVLGDDLSLNAQQVSGLRANRELPVVWQVALGSFVNKLILVPLALVISAFAPWAITPLLMVGGAYLCFEGVEKVFHHLHTRRHPESIEQKQARLVSLENEDGGEFEKQKVKGAIRTDFILSAEIVAITLGIVAGAPLLNQVLILAGIAIVVTIGVYGLVAIIVKIDDLGYWLTDKTNRIAKILGNGLLALAPKLMKTLTVVGTLAMFLVGGGIVIHGIPALHHVIEKSVIALGSFGSVVALNVANLLLGFLIGSCVLLAVNGVNRLLKKVA